MKRPSYFELEASLQRVFNELEAQEDASTVGTDLNKMYRRVLYDIQELKQAVKNMRRAQ